MKIANSNGRAVLVLSDDVADIETASGGEFGFDELDNPDDLALGCAVDGETVQESWIEGIGTFRNPCTPAPR